MNWSGWLVGVGGWHFLTSILWGEVCRVALWINAVVVVLVGFGGLLNLFPFPDQVVEVRYMWSHGLFLGTGYILCTLSEVVVFVVVLMVCLELLQYVFGWVSGVLCGFLGVGIVWLCYNGSSMVFWVPWGLWAGESGCVAFRLGLSVGAGFAFSLQAVLYLLFQWVSLGAVVGAGADSCGEPVVIWYYMWC